MLLSRLDASLHAGWNVRMLSGVAFHQPSNMEPD
jgi:hypothetical protein